MKSFRSLTTLGVAFMASFLISTSMASASTPPDPPQKPNCGSDIESVYISGSTTFKIVGTNLWRWLGQGGYGYIRTSVDAPGMPQKSFTTNASGQSGARSGNITVNTARRNIGLYVMLNNNNDDTLCTKTMGV